jgi:tRNA pseudouridine55 synthase
MASGVLPLVIGRATRLARFLDADDKRYEATVRLGFSTDTYDALGQSIGVRHAGQMPSPETIERALDVFRGTFLQQPPAYSAKKIDGRRSYRLARAHARANAAVATVPALPAQLALPAPARVTARSIELISIDSDLVFLRIVCSGGFYVRSLAYDLGQVLGVGAHLAALRRTEASGMTLAEAVPLATIEHEPDGVDRAREALLPLARMLPDIPSVTLTVDGVRRAASGCDLGPRDVGSAFAELGAEVERGDRFRLLDPGGELVGMAERSSTPGLLHPAVILV